MSSPPEPPATIDPNLPSAARVYDAFLGGTHNFAADRAVAARATELVPDAPRNARDNRAFLRRAVRFAASRGIRQFLDLGSGIPTSGNVHEVAREAAPDARVVYVDVDPSAVLYARHLLGADPLTRVVLGDAQRPELLLTDPTVRNLLDPGRPMCLLMLAVLHFLPDSPALDAAMRAYRDAAAPGSLLAISHITGGTRPEEMDRIADLYNRTGTPLVPRNPDRVLRFFDGWELVAPGLVYTPQWRPGPDDDERADPASSLTLAGVAGLVTDATPAS
ncbi:MULTISPECIES: SAM-dependent methyltransferase [Actinoplanes]|uniref:SAM-dependent methyltransferase n=1 Tax=Actinoplanes TaxID=1865 RepID=UPI0007C6BBB9|nr:MULTISPECIES: SAM-dependent methyltransferase [Actinoplanes]GLY06823.1 hypothetical protein Acsp01_72020 [Actinoplanes sp. NBRC 101535]